MILWVDDLREPAAHGYLGAAWAKTYDEAITHLKTGNVTFVSLDHDLGWGEASPGTTSQEKTGYSVVCWMEENDVWPKNGVRVHSSNPPGKQKMLLAIAKHYNRIFP